MKIEHPYPLAGAVFGFILFEVLLVLFIDQPLSLYMRELDVWHPGFVDIFRAFTDFGKSAWYLWPSGIGLIVYYLYFHFGHLPRRAKIRVAAIGKKFLFFFTCIAVSGIVSDIIKPIVGRARPVLLDHNRIYGFSPFSFDSKWNSMPSGHSTTACALAAVLIILAPRGRIAWVVLAFMLTLSRIIVNAHYLSDTIAGAAVGLLTVWLAQRWFRKHGNNLVKNGIFPIDRRRVRR